MQAITHGSFGMLIGIPGEQNQAIQRVEHTERAKRWWRSAQIIEIWVLPDGRRVRLWRKDQTQDWQVRWV